MYLLKSCYYRVTGVKSVTWRKCSPYIPVLTYKIPIIPVSWSFLQQTLPRLYGGCDVNKCPLGTWMQLLSISLLMSKSKIWLMFLVTVYYEMQLVGFSFHSTYLQVAKSSILHGTPPVFPLMVLVQKQVHSIIWGKKKSSLTSNISNFFFS